ncbi:MAG: hypothetical protein K0U93_08935 [Gammaproteobacteria bacterium]|nr:hypothetical protein [Gammaproteobacteria bacterium]
MKQRLNLRGAALTVVLIATTISTGALADSSSHRFEIVRASDSQIWRLDKQTGEVTVCALDVEQLICTSSAQAITPPAKSYAQLEAEREAQAEHQRLRREQKRQQRLAMLNMVVNAFSELATQGARLEDSH